MSGEGSGSLEPRPAAEGADEAVALAGVVRLPVRRVGVAWSRHTHERAPEPWRARKVALRGWKWASCAGQGGGCPGV